jgi:TRAP-type mannitol/chloroaromatic compound transport system permease large subunit
MTERLALTNALVFFIFFGATLFAFVLRAIGGDEFAGFSLGFS